MNYNDVTKEHEMIDYLIDCTLATVEDMLYPKKIRIREFERQCTIAQKGIDFLGKNYPFKSRAKYFAKEGISALEYYTKKREEYHTK